MSSNMQHGYQTRGKWAKAHSMSDGKIYFGLARSPVPISSHSKLLVLIFMFAVASMSIDLGGVYTCQDDIIKFMNIAFLQDCSK